MVSHLTVAYTLGQAFAKRSYLDDDYSPLEDVTFNAYVESNEIGDNNVMYDEVKRAWNEGLSSVKLAAQLDYKEGLPSELPRNVLNSLPQYAIDEVWRLTQTLEHVEIQLKEANTKIDELEKKKRKPANKKTA